MAPCEPPPGGKLPRASGTQHTGGRYVQVRRPRDAHVSLGGHLLLAIFVDLRAARAWQVGALACRARWAGWRAAELGGWRAAEQTGLACWRAAAAAVRGAAVRGLQLGIGAVGGCRVWWVCCGTKQTSRPLSESERRWRGGQLGPWIGSHGGPPAAPLSSTAPAGPLSTPWEGRPRTGGGYGSMRSGARVSAAGGAAVSGCCMSTTAGCIFRGARWPLTRSRWP